MLSKKDISIIINSLGRYPRGAYKVSYRCECSKPVVVKVKPKLPDSTPFPTTFYLVDKILIKKVSRLESEGFMKKLNYLLKSDLTFKEKYKSAHFNYISQRWPKNPTELKNISVGGAPNYIKCLHAHLAHSLAIKNINPVGDILINKLNINNKCFHLLYNNSNSYL